MLKYSLIFSQLVNRFLFLIYNKKYFKEDIALLALYLDVMASSSC